MSKSITPAAVGLGPVGAAVVDGPGMDSGVGDVGTKDLRRKTARGALVSVSSQVATLFFRTGSMVILARLLIPKDFGLVGMVTAFTGFLGLFRDAGLSMATVQRVSITHQQTSTLFWVNVAVGAGLSAIAIIAAPILVSFYGEPRLFWVTIALGTSFIFNGIGAQHRAMLQRAMRFGVLAIIEIVSLIVSTALGIGMAIAGQSYWALVMMTIAQPLLSTLGVWLASGWVPGKPERRSGIRSMLKYGGTVTLNNVIVYLAYNAEKVLLGRFCGAEALGYYGRAYQLINLPTENLNSTIGLVAFPALSRVQNDPERLRSYFLKGYTLFLSLVMPITLGCALFAEDIVRVFLGPKWNEAAGVFRLLAPTILTFALINPFAWMMLASGRAGRSLRIALLIAPVVILSYLLGLKNGTHGVAAGFSMAMILLVVPVVAWAKHGTSITTRDVLKAVRPPFVAILVGTLASLGFASLVAAVEPVFLRLVVESAILFGAYSLVLLFVMKQKPIYADLLKETGLWPLRIRKK